MKKFVVLFLCIIIPTYLFAQYKVGDIYYNLIEKAHQAEVTSNGKRCYSGDIEIPQKIEVNGVTYDVTMIGESAFNQCEINSLILPNGLKKISSSAFEGVNINALTIPPTLEETGLWSFGGSIDRIIISDLSAWFKVSFNASGGNPLQCGAHLYLNGEEITEIVVPDDIKILKDAVFSGYKWLNSISFHNNITEIEGHAFMGCTNLTKVYIPDNVTSLGIQLFGLCTGLTEVRLPKDVKVILGNCFQECTNLKNVIVGSGTTEIQEASFCKCTNLENLYLFSKTLCNTRMPEIVFEGALIEYATLHVPYNLVDQYKNTFPWSGFGKIVRLPTLTYLVDNQEYKVLTPMIDEIITPEADPTKEGHTFSGWSEIPATMPGNDVTVKGTFTVNKYKLVYKVDGKEYKSYDIEYGTTISPEALPTKEGYTFSGWNNLPETMPANDVTVEGTFTINKYKLIYLVDGEEYKSYDIEYNSSITAESEPSKEGYTFSGWSEIPETMPANDVTVTGTFTVNKYKLVYKVDGAEYKSYDIEYGTTISPEALPTKEGYTFSGWNNLPETMPANDVTVEGTFTINKYKLVYLVDGEEYKSYDIEYNSSITAESEPSKEGYTFSGWSEIPETMPANDVTVTGTFTVNKYKLTYILDGVEYKTYEVEYGATISPETNPEKEGYTFSGWIDIPETMPAKDVTVTGSFTINKYKLTYIVDGEMYQEYELEYGSSISPESEPSKDGYTFSGWTEIPTTMPAHDVTIYGTFTQEEYIVDNVTYEINDNGTVTIKDYDQTGEVTIASTVIINGQTYQVTVIAEDAFKGKKDLISVTIPEGIITIGNNAFAGCIGLFKINIGKDVQTIGSRAFANVGTAAVRTRSEESTLVVKCYTESVPQTSSDAFENSPLDTGKLLVNDNLVNSYKSTYPWSEFGKIYAFNDPAGINTITIDSENAWIFDMQGNRFDNVRKGVNILRYKDGKTKKIVIK